ncbi:MAG TPA: cytochrome P450 [Byssovorax sp.]|jgi:cytochrome P450
MLPPPGSNAPALLALGHWLVDPLGSLDYGVRTFGDVYAVNNPLFGREVVVSHPELVRQIFIGDPDVYRAGEANAALGLIVGDRSVLLLDGARHHRERRLLTPSFHGERMTAFAATMRRAADRVIAGLPRGRPVATLRRMQDLTFEIILETVFGAGAGGDAKVDRLGSALRDLLDRVQSPLGMLWLFPFAQRDLGPLTGWAALARSLAAANAAIYDVISAARAKPRGADVLSMLLGAVDEDGEPMSDQELRDELVTLLLAGHETTATALAWALAEIPRHPEVVQRIEDEIAASDGSAAASMPFLDATIQEVLRVHPIVPLVGRRVSTDVKLRGYDVRAGTFVVINVTGVHHHPDAWTDPAEFSPARFVGKRPDPYAWLPFGGGARRCIGYAFALMETRVVLAACFAKLTFTCQPKPERVRLRGLFFGPSRQGEVEVGDRRVAERPRAAHAPCAT